MLTKDDANVLCALLDAISANAWHSVKEAVQEKGLDPRDVVVAWRKLEKAAGMNGTVPDSGDFE